MISSSVAKPLPSCLILWFLWLPSGEDPSPGPLQSPPVDRAASGGLLTTDETGQQRWQADWSMEEVVHEGETRIRFRETGSGRYSPFSQPVRWTVEAYWTSGDRYAPLSYQKSISDAAGNLRVTERRWFDWTRGTARFQRTDAEGKRSLDKTVKVPSDTLTPDGLALALQHLPFDLPRPVQAHFLSDEPKVYKVTFKMVERERLSTASGPVEAYKVQMDFHLGVLSLFKAFIPDIHFWFDARTPHYWVRYKGLESGRGTPVVVRTSTYLRRTEREPPF